MSKIINNPLKEKSSNLSDIITENNNLQNQMDKEKNPFKKISIFKKQCKNISKISNDSFKKN